MATSIRSGKGSYVRFAHSSGAADAAEELRNEDDESPAATCAYRALCSNFDQVLCACLERDGF